MQQLRKECSSVLSAALGSNLTNAVRLSTASSAARGASASFDSLPSRQPLHLQGRGFRSLAGNASPSLPGFKGMQRAGVTNTRWFVNRCGTKRQLSTPSEPTVESIEALVKDGKHKASESPCICSTESELQCDSSAHKRHALRSAPRIAHEDVDSELLHLQEAMLDAWQVSYKVGSSLSQPRTLQAHP
eukprot:3172218-Rhodomonas_salina.1